MNDSPIWSPSAEHIQATAMARFAQRAGDISGLPLQDYGALHRWSVEEPQAFWSLLAEFCGIQFHQGEAEVLLDAHRMPGARWFTGARLNFAENLLRRNDDGLAVIFRSECGESRELSYAQLRDQVERVAAGLCDAGVGRGDRVAGFLPNCPEAVIAMLATTSIGAVWSSCSPDFGVDGVLDRFGQIEPKILFTADAYRYGGRVFDCLSTAAAVASGIDSIRELVVVPFVNDVPDLSTVPGAKLLDAFAVGGRDLVFESLPFDHPVYILYSSGTTGAPKCIVHGSGGTLLQHVKEHVLHTDIVRDDCLFYFTTCGWMMWNWLVSGLASGATIVLFDGSPFHPGPSALWRLAEEVGITVFGTSAKYLSALEKSGFEPSESCSLPELRTVLSTGSPLSPESFDFVYRSVASHVQLASISGGTDIVACFAGGCPILPVYRGELQCPTLGMAVDIFDEQGRSLATGPGELVCTRPFPSMPLGFWNDPEGRRYHEAYFARFENVWAHGDFAERTEHGGFIIHGRSDAVLNPGGVRIGTAEIYRQVESLDEVMESIAVGQRWGDDVRVVLFVVLRDEQVLTDNLQDRIRKTIRARTTPRHVPAKIIQVPEIPRTRSGKIVELAVRAVIHGEPVKNTEALANPEALGHFADRDELQGD